MTLSDLINDAYLTYRGKLTNVPQTGSEKYTRILAIANRKQNEWAQDANVDWPSRYELRDGGSVSKGTQSYDLDDDIMRLSDYVQIGTTNVSVVKPQTIARYTSGCYMHGSDPKQLTFLTTIDSSLAGQTLTVPCFTLPPVLLSASDTVSVDNPQWLVYAVAAELSRNDYAKSEQYSNIIGQANDLYAKMVDDAQVNGFLQANGVMNNMPQYDGFTSTGSLA